MPRDAAILGKCRRVKSVLAAVLGTQDALIIDIKEIGGTPAAFKGTLWSRRRGHEKFLGALNPAIHLPAGAIPAFAVLRLPREITLHRQFVLPAKAERHLKTAIDFEIDRLTPFDSRELFWSISGVTREARNLRLTITFVPRSVVEPVLAGLRQMNLSPAVVETGFGCIPLGQRRARPANPQRNALAGACCAVALTLAGLPLLQQQSQLDQLNRQLAALQPARQALFVLHRQLAALDAVQAIAAAGRQNADPIEALAMLNNALPNGTWLNNLAITSNQITLSGQSDDAPQLISALANAPGFSNPSFVGPMTVNTDGTTMFSIEASIAK
jgi:general secretion pathway protein L